MDLLLFRKPIQNIDLGYGITLPIFKGPIGLLSSGGADSTLLMYFLMKYHTNKLVVYTVAEQAKHFTTAKSSAQVIDKCAKLTGKTDIEHRVKYVPVKTAKSVYSKPRLDIIAHKINALYEGMTNNPSEDIGNNGQHNRNPLIKKSIIEYKTHVQPFINVDKKIIASLYKKYKLQNLFNLTRSCETFEDIGLKHCGECWWCKERKWGFGKI